MPLAGFGLLGFANGRAFLQAMQPLFAARVDTAADFLERAKCKGGCMENCGVVARLALWFSGPFLEVRSCKSLRDSSLCAVDPQA